jgi:hypothetical protein
MLSLSGQWVTTAYRQRIQEAVTRPAHRLWFLRRFPHITTDQYESIDWRGIGLARRHKRHRHTSRITKLMAGWLNVGHQKMKMHKDGRCPCCGADDETQLHLFTCAQPDMTRARTAALVSMAAHLQECGVPKQLHRTFMDLVKHYLLDQPLPNDLPPDILAALNEQLQFGIDLTLRGYLSNKWVHAMANHTAGHIDRKMTALYTGLWTFLFEPIWQQRNNILHLPNSIASRYEQGQLNKDLMQWKAHTSRHTPSQTFIIGHYAKNITYSIFS